jgi:hypothetical protein
VIDFSWPPRPASTSLTTRSCSSTWHCGQAVVANAATQVLLRQAPQAIDTVTEAFRLSAGEREFLLAANRGQGLLAAGTHRVGFQVIASDIEHQLVTTDPEFLVPGTQEVNRKG